MKFDIINGWFTIEVFIVWFFHILLMNYVIVHWIKYWFSPPKFSFTTAVVVVVVVESEYEKQSFYTWKAYQPLHYSLVILLLCI